MSTGLGMAKVYLSKEDFAKMLKLKDSNNLYVGEIKNEYGRDVEITIITPMDNVTNSRVKLVNGETHNLYYDCELKSDNNGLTRATIFYKDGLHYINGTFDVIAKYISDLCKDDYVYIYGDIHGFGIAIADYLKELGYVVSNINIKGLDVSKGGRGFMDRVSSYHKNDKAVLNKPRLNNV